MVELKYKVGDRVLIKSLDWYNNNKDENDEVIISSLGHVFTHSHSKYAGRVMTVGVVSKLGFYILKEDKEANRWYDEMIEGLVEDTTIKVKDLRKFINQMEIEGLNDETVLTFEIKRSSGCIENITSMEYSPTTNILIFS
jgi:hypothetical protein